MKKAIIVFSFLILSLVAFLLLRESWLFTIDLDGFLYPSDSIKNSLMSGGELATVYDAVPAADSDEVYLQRRQYFVDNGESRSGVIIDLPLISRDGSRVLVLDEGEAITSKYQAISTFRGAVVADGAMYNLSNNDQVDREKYLFLKNDKFFTTLSGIGLTTMSQKKVNIPKNSLIFFERNTLRYYDLDTETAKYNFHEITGIDATSRVEFPDDTLTYEGLLKKLGIWDAEREEYFEEIAEAEEPERPDNHDYSTPTPSPEPSQPKENSPSEGKWEDYVNPDKLEARANFKSADTYSAIFNFYIHDPKGEIVRYPTVELYNGDKIYSRKTFYSTGDSEIAMLMPDTEYHYQIYYIYKNEEGKQIRSTLDEGDFRTSGIDDVEPITFSYGDVIPQTNSATIRELSLKNNQTDKVLKGLQKITIVIDGQEYKFSTGSITALRNLETIAYDTPNILHSNTFYHLELVAYDVAGNKLSVVNSGIDLKTIKATPSAKLTIEDSDFTWFDASIALSNPDNVNLDNFRYVLLDGNSIIREGLVGNDRHIREADLSDNRVYRLLVYADFDLDDGVGIRRDQLLADSNISTATISTLGNLRLTLTKNSVTKDTADFNLEINSRTTDPRLVAMLDVVNLYLTNGDGELVRTISFDGRDFDRLTNYEQLSLIFNNLATNTDYVISGDAKIKQGNMEYPVEVILNLYEFRTLKASAEADVIDTLATQSMIDYSVRINDPDGSILSDRVLMEVRKSNGEMVGVEDLEINGDYRQFSYKKLDGNTRYIVTFLAENYNEGPTDATADPGHILATVELSTSDDKMSGSIYLESLLRQQTGKNHYEIDNMQRWKSTSGTSTVTDRNYNFDEKSTVLSVQNGYRNYAYFVPELAGKVITVSFDARLQSLGSYDPDIASSGAPNIPAYVANGDGETRTCAIDNKTTTKKSYTCTFTLNNNGYIGFLLYEVAAKNRLTELEISNLQIEEGNSKTDYEDYQSKANEAGEKLHRATVRTNFRDALSDPKTDNNNFYIKIYRFGEYVGEIDEPLDAETHSVVDKFTDFDVRLNSGYVAKLIVKVNGVDHEISSTEFTTETEIRPLDSVDALKKMHTTGKYIVTRDLDLRDQNVSNVNTTIFNAFHGTLDFQGYKLIMDTYGAPRRLTGSFYGTLRNVDVRLYLNSPSAFTYFWGFTEYNYGNIENFMVTIEEGSTEVGYGSLAPLVRYNFGTISNFVVHLKSSIYGAFELSALCVDNRNIIRNGYLYADEGAAIVTNFEASRNRNPQDVGAVASLQRGSGRLENVFSLIDVNSNDMQQRVANLIGRVDNSSTISHVYSNAGGENRVTTDDINWIPRNSYDPANFTLEEMYYVSDTTYADRGSARIPSHTLRDVDFQNNVLNTYGAFDVNSYVTYGYYPHLNLPSSMPNQDFISLPTPEDFEVDITSVVDVEQLGNNSARITLEVYNPSAYKITSLNITGLSNSDADSSNLVIESQLDSAGRSEVTFVASNPPYYYSSYSAHKIEWTEAHGAISVDRSRTYASNERLLSIEMFRGISTVSDWAGINASASTLRQNYILENDIDFSDQPENILRLGAFRGKLDGNKKTIKNINITSGDSMIVGLYGVVQNLFVENYTKSSLTERGGLISTAYVGSQITNVHMRDISILANNYVGGLAGYINSAVIQESSVNTMSIPNIDRTVERTLVGGLVGYMDGGSLIQNSFASNIDLDIRKAPNVYAIGGLVGEFYAGTIDSVYATGKIQSKSPTNGGLVGWAARESILKNGYSNVDIFTSSNVNIGGITGEVTFPSRYSVSSTLSAGAIYSSLSGGTVRRILGGFIIVSQPNFAWSDQHINGVITADSSGEILLDTEALNNIEAYTNMIEMGGAFDYSSLGDNSLPPLFNRNRSELLPNQDRNYLKSYDFEIKNIQIDQSAVDAEIYMEIDNPSNAEITSVEIEDVEITRVLANQNRDGKTIYRLKVEPNYYYDSYRLTKVNYVKDGVPGSAEHDTKIEMQFFRSLKTVSDWNSINQYGSENYRLENDIDFSGATVKQNLYINRLEGSYESGDEQGFALKNITINGSSNNVGLIHSISSSLKNVTFKDFNITNTGSNVSRTGIILFEYGDAEHLVYDNVTINALNSKYVGMIADNLSFDTRDIRIRNSNVTGSGYTGGYSGRMKPYNATGITISDTNVTSNSNYVGGFVGQQEYANYLLQFDITASNINVTGRERTGGIYGVGSGTNLTLKDSKITGTNYTGGIYGQLSAERATTSSHVDHSEIKSSGSYVGGIAGHGSTSLSNSDTKNSTITASGSYVGGIFGTVTYDATSQRTINSSTVESSEVKGNGNYVGGVCGTSFVNGASAIKTKVTGNKFVGGICGHGATVINSRAEGVAVSGVNYVGGAVGLDNWGNQSWNVERVAVVGLVADGATTPSTVNGSNYVGGLVGASGKYDSTYLNSNNNIRYNIANAEVVATGSSAGGLIGYMNNAEYEEVSGRSRINYRRHNVYNNIVENATVKASSNAGGLIGTLITQENSSDTSRQFYNRTGLRSERIYRNVIVANVETTSASSDPGVIIGNGDNQIVNAAGVLTGTDLKVYENSKMTDAGTTTLVSNYSGNSFNKNRVGILSLANLKTTSTYTNIGINTSNFNFDNISSHFPRLAAVVHSLVPLPPASVTLSSPLSTAGPKSRSLALSTTSTPIYRDLPTFVVYPSAANAINIEFSDVDEMASFSLNGVSYPIVKRVFSFSYDFATKLDLSLTNGVSTKESTYTPEDLRSNLSTIGENYYVLKNGKLITNTSFTDIEALNLFRTKVLTPDYDILDLETREIETPNTSSLELLEEAIPLHHSESPSTSIETFANFSIVDDTNLIEKQLLTKGAQTEIISPDLKNIKWNVTMDSYNSKDYLTILGEDGIIYDLKTKLTYPEAFTNDGIKEITDNVSVSSPLMAVRYEDGKVTIFNYRSGEVVYRLQSDSVPTPLDYLISQIAPASPAVYDSNSLEAGLESANNLTTEIKSGSVVSSNTTIPAAGNYITSYNPVKDAYELYELNELLTTTPLGVNLSVSDQIYSDNTLNLRFGHYLSSKKARIEPIAIVIYAGIVIAITASMLILGDLLRKKHSINA